MARYQIKKKKQDDESSESRRYSYKSKKKPQSGAHWAKKPTGKKPIDDRSANPPTRRPHPMIQPLNDTLPVQKLRSQAAHTFNYTPEAYKELRKVPIVARPATDEDEPDVPAYYARGGGNRDADRESIHLLQDWGGAVPHTLAHEQSHAWWDHNRMEGETPARGFFDASNDWRDQPGESAADRAYDLAPLDPDRDPREWNQWSPYRVYEDYARTVESSPDEDRSTWPDAIRPYYSGFLQGMDRLSTGEPTPPVPQNHPVRPWARSWR